MKNLRIKNLKKSYFSVSLFLLSENNYLCKNRTGERIWHQQVCAWNPKTGSNTSLSSEPSQMQT